MATEENPEDAPEDCPGVGSENAGKQSACDGCPNQKICASGPVGPDPDLVAIAERLRHVKHKILVLSGKGGVGKSTTSAQIAYGLAKLGKEVGLLDIDICGPSIPRLMGLEGQEIHQSGSGWSPVYVDDNLGVMSIGFMLPKKDDPIIWRGPRKNSLIKQFIKDVDWGELDYLVIDTPPGTSDEHISISQYLLAAGLDGAVIVTMPQDLSINDVRKEINFCKKVKIPVIGVVENMAGLRQKLPELQFSVVPSEPTSGTAVTAVTEEDITELARAFFKEKFPGKDVVVKSDIFLKLNDGAEGMSREFDVPFLGRIPLDPNIGRACEEGTSTFENRTFGTDFYEALIEKIRVFCGDGSRAPDAKQEEAPDGSSVDAKKIRETTVKNSHGEIPMDPLLGSRIHLGF